MLRVREALLCKSPTPPKVEEWDSQHSFLSVIEGAYLTVMTRYLLTLQKRVGSVMRRVYCPLASLSSE